jgi:aquaporin Z
VGNVGIAFAFGLAQLAMIYAIGNISGSHINPAVTIAVLVAGKISVRDAVFYIVSQFLGAIAGAGILLGIASGKAGYSLTSVGLGQNGFGAASPAGYPLAACFGAEVVLTALFLFVILGATGKDAPRGFAGVAVGFSLAFIHLLAIPVDGTSVNPARSLGPAVLVGGTALSQLWLFIVAPVIGGIIAALIWKYALKEPVIKPIAPKEISRK